MHQVEVEGTLGEEAAPTKSKPEGEEARTAVANSCSGVTGANVNDDGLVQIAIISD